MSGNGITLPFTIMCPQNNYASKDAIDGALSKIKELESKGLFKESFEMLWCLKENQTFSDKLSSRLYFYKLINYNFELLSNLYYYFKTYKKIPKIDFDFINTYILGSSKQPGFNFDKAKQLIKDLNHTQDGRLIAFREQLKKWLEEGEAIKPIIKLGGRQITTSEDNFTNEDIGKLLTITVPVNKDRLNFEVIINNQKEDLLNINLKAILSKTNPLIAEYELDISSLMTLVKIGDTFKIRAITNSSSFNYHPAGVGIFGPKKESSITFTRKINGVLPNSAHYPQNIQKLYEAFAEDIKEGKPVVTTLSLILWKDIAPEKNLYWTSGGGVYYYFKKYWKLEYEAEVDLKGGSGKPFKILVFSKTIKPNEYWKSKGITKSFKIYLMVRGFYWKDIELAYKDFSQNLFDIQDKSITLKDGTIISTKDSRVVGLLGHRIEGGWGILGRTRKFSLNPPIKGSFIMGCTSGPYFQSYTMQRPNTYGLMFTRDLMFPGAFALQAMLEGMGEGLSGPKLIQKVNKSYSEHQKLDHIQRLYINQEEVYFKKFENPFLGDADGDGIENRIDPEPTMPNNYEFSDDTNDSLFNSLKIHLSNGQKIKLLILKDYFNPPSLFLAPK